MNSKEIDYKLSPLILLLSVLLPITSIANSKVLGDGIREKIYDNISLFQKCHSEGVKTNSKLAGKVILSWDVLESGLVKNAQVKSSTIKDSNFLNCLIKTIAVIRFPLSSGVANVSFPFVFDVEK